jgi:hypothetical protein
MTTASTRQAKWWSALTTLPTRVLTALADNTRDWRRGCGL